MSDLDLSHLHESRREIAMRDPQTRIASILSDRWITYKSAIDALARMEALLLPNSKQRKQSLLLIAPSNNGKTTILNRFARKHSGENVNGDHISLPVLTLEMPSSPDLHNFQSAILTATMTPFNPTAPRHAKDLAISRVLTALGVRVVILDEFSNVLLAGPKTFQVVMSEIRSLSNRHGLSFIAAGVPSSTHALSRDGHLLTRFDVIELEKWSLDAEFQRFIAAQEKLLPLREPSGLARSPYIDLIYEACDGIIGNACEIINGAAVDAIQSSSEHISLDRLKDAIRKKKLAKRVLRN